MPSDRPPRFAPGDDHDRVRSMRLRSRRSWPELLKAVAAVLVIVGCLVAFARMIRAEKAPQEPAYQPRQGSNVAPPSPAPLRHVDRGR
jgi:hypothetical protein